MFYGLGSDGTVGANKNSIKIIGDHTDMYAQAYFSYDSKKSGGITVSHLRFGKSPIMSTYLIDSADFIACHNPAYVTSTTCFPPSRTAAYSCSNSPWTAAEMEEQLPASMKQALAGSTPSSTPWTPSSWPARSAWAAASHHHAGAVL